MLWKVYKGWFWKNSRLSQQQSLRRLQNLFARRQRPSYCVVGSIVWFQWICSLLPNKGGTTTDSINHVYKRCESFRSSKEVFKTLNALSIRSNISINNSVAHRGNILVGNFLYSLHLSSLITLNIVERNEAVHHFLFKWNGARFYLFTWLSSSRLKIMLLWIDRVHRNIKGQDPILR